MMGYALSPHWHASWCPSTLLKETLQHASESELVKPDTLMVVNYGLTLLEWGKSGKEVSCSRSSRTKSISPVSSRFVPFVPPNLLPLLHSCAVANPAICTGRLAGCPLPNRITSELCISFPNGSLTALPSKFFIVLCGQ